MSTPKEEFEQWFEEERAKGLIDFKVTLNPDCNSSNTTPNDFYLEMLAINKAIARGDVKPYSDAITEDDKYYITEKVSPEADAIICKHLSKL